LIWFIAESLIKVDNGTTNLGWIFFYIAVAAMIFNGLRGCWWLCKSAHLPSDKLMEATQQKESDLIASPLVSSKANR